jgi:uncharacterized protein
VIPIKVTDDAVTFAVRVHPRAKKNTATGMVGDAMKLSVTAPPVDSRANDAVIKFFAAALRLPQSSITIAAGQSSRNKVVRIATKNAVELQQQLEQLIKT